MGRGLRAIADRIHRLTATLAEGLRRLGLQVAHEAFFDTLRVEVADADEVLRAARERRINLRRLAGNAVGISLDETTDARNIVELWAVFGEAGFSPEEIAGR